MKNNKTFFKEIKDKYFPDRNNYDRTKEDIEKELKSKKYKNLGEWRNKKGSGYSWASTQPFYEELRNKFFPDRRKNDRTREEVEQELKKYKTIKEWRTQDNSSYSWALKQSWYKEIQKKYLISLQIKDRTREDIEKELTDKKYKNMTEWEKVNPATYCWSYKQKWYPEIRKKYFPNAMCKVKNRTKASIEIELKKEKYKNIGEWIDKNENSYAWAYKQKWYPRIKKKYFIDSFMLYRDKKIIERELQTKKYKNIAEWKEKNNKFYIWARIQPWYPEIRKKYFPNAKKK